MRIIAMMRRLTFAAFLCTSFALHAQNFDPQLAGEVNLIRARLAQDNMALRQYTWTERTEILEKGKVKSTREAECRYDANGLVVKRPINPNPKDAKIRTKSDKEDYIERAVTMIGNYVPPDPQQIDAMLARGAASVEPSTPGQLAVRFKGYYQGTDSFIVSYDPSTKMVKHVTVLTSIGGTKDPVTLDAIFETLPDGVNHMASATVSAKAQKVEVKTRNLSYVPIK